MKKSVSVLLILTLLLGLCTACASNEGGQKKLSVVTTVFPVYDWVREVLGDRVKEVELTMLADTGVDLHSFQPTADDMIKLAGCDLFVYVGGESDEWVGDALKTSGNADRQALYLLELPGLTAKEEEVKEGMEAEDEEEEAAPDEHVWLSLKNASVCVSAIRDALVSLDEANGQTYQAAASAYLEKLSALDGQYRAAVDAAPKKTVLFGDRFPFRYLVDDYGLDYFAAFLGCSAESEASFETISFLAEKVDELDLSVVLTLEGTDHKIAQTVIETAKKENVRILSMDSMQSVTGNDAKKGVTYLSVMEKNLGVLKDALA